MRDESKTGAGQNVWLVDQQSEISWFPGHAKSSGNPLPAHLQDRREIELRMDTDSALVGDEVTGLKYKKLETPHVVSYNCWNDHRLSIHQRAGRHLCHDALDGRARGGPAAHAAIGWRAGGALPHLLVSALRLRPTARSYERRRGGFGAGIFRAVSGEELSRGLERGTRSVSRLPAGGVETFSRERMGQVAGAEARRRRGAPVAGLADGGHEVSVRGDERAESRPGFRPRMGFGVARQSD